jgi:hypothetical protein
VLFDIRFGEHSKIFFDMSGQYIINFRMPGYRLFLERFGIDINVMIRAMPVETTSGLMQLPNQFRSLHSATSFI